MTYGYCKKIIASGKYDKNEMKDKLDVFLLANRITDEQYKELMQMMEGSGLFWIRFLIGQVRLLELWADFSPQYSVNGIVFCGHCW